MATSLLYHDSDRDCVYDKYGVCFAKGGNAMNTKEQIQRQLEDLRRELKGITSMLEMMQKGTKAEDLAKMRREKLEPIREAISRLEGKMEKLD